MNIRISALRTRPSALLRGLAASALLLGTSFLGQQALAQEALPGVFSEVIDVRVINLEVVVTDRDGNPVSGLQPSDFELEIDGRSVPVEYFTEVFGGLAKPLVTDQESDVRGLPSLEPGEEVGNSFLIFVDDFFSIAQDRNQVLRSVADQLDLLGPNDRVAMVAFDGRQLEMLTTWTDSRQSLDRAFSDAMVRKAHGLERLVERRSALDQARVIQLTNQGFLTLAQDTLDRDTLRNLTPVEREYVQRIGSQVERTTTAAAATLRSFGGPPGRKVMMLLSGGWPFDPTSFVETGQPKISRELGLDMAQDSIQHLVDTANRLGYTIYPVDVPGLRYAGPGADAAAPTNGGLDLAKLGTVQTLERIAEETGGRAQLYTNRTRVLERVASDVRSYYWLGFSPAGRENDERHDIRLEVRNPEFRIRYRADYVDLSKSAEVSMMAESALLFGNAPSSYALPLEHGKPVKAGYRKISVPIKMAIPMEAITLLPVGERWVGRIELRVAALDANGERSEVPVIPLDLTSSKQPSPGSHIAYETELTLRKIDQTVVVSVYDPSSGQIVSSRFELDV